jgi:hypothetical protein
MAVNILWARWAPDGRKFITELRKKGGERADQKLWLEKIKKPREEKRLIPWIPNSPLEIISDWLPKILILGWFLILVVILFEAETK